MMERSSDGTVDTPRGKILITLSGEAASSFRTSENRPAPPSERRGGEGYTAASLSSTNNFIYRSASSMPYKNMVVVER